MKYCTNCGAKLDEGTKFCPNCGAPVTAAGTSSARTVPAGEDAAETNSNTGEYPDWGGTEVIESGDPVDWEDGTGREAYSRDEAPHKQKRKRSKKPLIIILIIIAAVIVAFLILAAIGGESVADQKVVYEGIEFQVPAKWKLDEDSSSDAGLYFYTNGETGGEMLYMVSVPDVSYILDLFGADYVMDWMTEYIHEQTGGDTVDAQKIQTAGYDTYLYDVTGVSTDVNGESVEGGYRIACILNTDKSEMILVYAYGLSAGENDQKILSDIDYILGNATKTSEENSY